MSLYETMLTAQVRTLRFAGEISMPYRRLDDGSIFFNPQNLDRAVWSGGEIFFGPYQIEIAVYAGHVGRDIADGVAGHYTLEIGSFDLGINYSDSVELWPAFPGPGGSYGGTITGSYQIEIDVAEEREVTSLVLPEIPWWNTNDGPATIVNFRERLRGSGNVRVNISFGALSYNNSFSRPNSESIGSGIGGYVASLAATVASREVSGPQTAFITCDNTNMWKRRANSTSKSGTIPYQFGTSAGESVSNVPFSQTCNTSSGVSASHDYAGGVYSNSSFGGGYLTTGCSVLQYVPIKSVIHGRVMCFEDDCPDTMVFNLFRTPAGSDTLTVPPGGATKAIQQINGDYAGPDNLPILSVPYGLGTVGSYSHTEFPYDDDGEPLYTFEVRLDESAFPADTDETSDPRVQGRGPIFGELAISHDAEEVLEAFSGPSGWTPANSTLGGSSSLTIETDAVSGGATRIYSPSVSTESWRYWNLRSRSVGEDNVNFRIRINEKKSFFVQTGLDGVYEDIQIDTAFPGIAESGVPLQQDSRWPVKGASDNRPVNEAKNWGINYIEKLEILEVPAGVTIELDELKGITLEQPRLQFVSAHWNSKAQWYSLAPAASPDRKRHGLFLVDGRTGHEIPDAQGTTLSPLTIDQYAAEINAVPGWSAGLSGFGDSYFDSSLLGQFVAGEGATWDASGFATYTDKPMVASTLAVPCQFLFDRLSIYPGIGDVWEGTGYDDAEAVLNLRYLKFMRGTGHGFAIKGSRPSAGTTVTIYRQPNDDARGSGVSDSGGFFTTGSPYGFGNRDHQFRSPERVLGSGNIYTRKRQRLSGKVSDPRGGRIAYDISSALRHYRAFIDNSDIVQVGYSDNRIDWTDVDTAIEGIAVGLTVERVGKQAVLYLWVIGGDGALRRYASDNEGETWGMPTTIATGDIKGISAEIGLNNHRYVYWIDEDPAVVKGRIYDPSDQPLTDAFTAIESVDEDGLAVGESVERGGRHRIVILVNQGGVLKSFKSFNGIDNWI